MVIHDPLSDALVSIDDTTDTDMVNATAEINGEHNIIFFNPFALQAITVDVSWEINP